jgi:hypothetical protein
MVHESLKVA